MFVTDLVFKLKGLDINKALKYLDDNRNRDSISLRDAIVSYHKQHNPLYKKKIGNKVIHSFEDLPIITKKDFQEPLENIISETYKLSDLYVANTSGSSGHPFFYAKNKESHSITHAIIHNLYAQHGIDVNSKQARFYGIPSSGISRFKELCKDKLCNRVRFSVFDLSDENLKRYLERFRRTKFDYVYGYTSAIVLFSKYIISQGLILKNICSSIKVCIVTSEVCTSDDKALIEKAMGVKVVNEYGCSEAGMVAFDDSDGVWRMVTDDSYFEIVDDKGNLLPLGCEGKILVTSLSNKAMPIIRYEIGDVGIMGKDGKGLYLKSLSGRVSDVIKLPSGRVAGGLTFYYVSRTLLEKSNIIREFIVRQTALDTFVFDVVSIRDFTEKEKTMLQQQIDIYLEPGLKVIINKVDKIERPSSGKLKHFYSQI